MPELGIEHYQAKRASLSPITIFMHRLWAPDSEALHICRVTESHMSHGFHFMQTAC